MRGIRYISWRRPTGYGEAARRYMIGLRRLEVPVTWTPMVPGRGWGWGFGSDEFQGRSVGDSELDPICNLSIPYDVVVVHLTPDYYPGWAEREAHKRLVGYTVWETDRIPRHWPRLLNRMDQVVVPSEWNRDVIRDGGVTAPIEVVPHSLDGNSTDVDEPVGAAPSSDFVFYTIGTWSVRKAIWNTLEAYLRAFTDKDRVELVIKTTEQDLSGAHIPFTAIHPFKSKAAIMRMQRRYPHGPKVSAVTDETTEEEIQALHRRGDCFVSLCRAEGWGLGAFDAAAQGKPVIMTGYGGQREFLPRELAYLVDYKLEPVRSPRFEKWYTSDQQWATPDLDQASRLMRMVYEQQGEARRRGEALRESVSERFGQETIARRLLRAIESS